MIEIMITTPLDFEIKVRNKRLLRHAPIRKWIKETEKYLNYKLAREIEGLLKHEVDNKVKKMIYGSPKKGQTHE